MDSTKLVIQILSTGLNAAPIPEPFKSAGTVIPDLVLSILDIVEAVKANREDAAALVVYIADVTMVVMRPFETKPNHSLDDSSALKSRIDEFKVVLEQIKQDLTAMMPRRRLKRIFTYASDASKLAEMKNRVGEAANRLQLETVIATGHGVDMIGQEQRLIFQKQEFVIQQQWLMIQKQQFSAAP
ncbi:hypothetical protein FRB95_006755 [Tulasnella sp. JGI-2019a]|nr:hypothetical protein FRB95_006755 [Tulasnella sp. JGI-2019a]